MTQPDWSKAPKGATHWGPDNEDWFSSWYRLVEGDWLNWNVDDERWVYDVDQEGDQWSVRRGQLIPRPAKPRWRYHWGGPCPKQWGKVDVLSRNGEIYTGIHARLVSWSHPWQEGEDPGEDIIAYLHD